MRRVQQWSREDLTGKTHQEIHAAQVAGHLAEMLGAPVPVDPEPGYQATREDLAGLSNADILKLGNGGHLDSLLGRG